jgi:hypothetical protein
MYWYNPTTRTSERTQAPSTDEQAIGVLSGTPDSAEFVAEYLGLRRSGSPIEQALVLVGHEFRLREQEYRLILRERSRFCAAEDADHLRGNPFHALDARGQQEEGPRFRLDDQGEAVAPAVAIVVRMCLLFWRAFVPEHPSSEAPCNIGWFAAVR